MSSTKALFLGALCLLLFFFRSAGPATAIAPTANMWPDFSTSPSSDAGCASLTSAVSDSTGGLLSAPPASSSFAYIDQEDTSYTSGDSGASFCSYQFTGSAITVTSATATLFLMEGGPGTDSWPVTVSLFDLTTCTTYASSPCTPVASGSPTLSGVPTDQGGCANSGSYVVTLTTSGSATLTNGDLYGMTVSAVSNDGNGFNSLTLCTGPTSVADPTMLSVVGGSSPPPTGVPQFPEGIAVIVGISMVGLALISSRRKASPSLRLDPT